LQVSPSGSAVAAFYFNEKGANTPAPVIVFDINTGDVLSQLKSDIPITGDGWISSGQLLIATATDHALRIRALP
jgi:hypothetical protein